MRKAGLIILTFLYLAFTAGVSVQRHYCMNRMASVRFSAHPEDRCSICGMEQSERSTDCCRDETDLFKITDDQQPPFAAELITPGFIFIQSSTDVTDVIQFTKLTTTGNFSHGPPGKAPVPLFVRNRVFRI